MFDHMYENMFEMLMSEVFILVMVKPSLMLLAYVVFPLLFNPYPGKIQNKLVT